MEMEELERRFPKTYAEMDKGDLVNSKNELTPAEIGKRLMTMTRDGRTAFLKSFFMGLGVAISMDDEGTQFPESNMDPELDVVMSSAVSDMSDHIQLLRAISTTNEGVRQDAAAAQSVDDFSGSQERAGDAELGVEDSNTEKCPCEQDGHGPHTRACRH